MLKSVDIHIQYLNSAAGFIGRLRSDPALQWMALAGLQALLSIWLVQESRDVPSTTLLAVVIWGGAVICMEDQLEDFRLRPSGFSLFAGLVLLAIASWRSVAVVVDYDPTVFVLPLLQGLGLALLARPIRQLWSLRAPLLVLALFGLDLVLRNAIPEYGLSVLTGFASQWILLVFGIQSSQEGAVLIVGEEAVRIAGQCTGADLMAQLTVIAIVFVLAFPLGRTLWQLLYVAIAPVIAFFVNASRIALLAVINGSGLPHKRAVFDFIHDGWGGLIFAGIAVLVIGQIYLAMIDLHLRERHG